MMATVKRSLLIIALVGLTTSAKQNEDEPGKAAAATAAATGGQKQPQLLQADQPPVLAPFRCPNLPKSFPFKKDLIVSDYNATSETLFLDLTDIIYKFCSDSVYSPNISFSFKLDLISTQRNKKRNLKCPESQSFVKDSKSVVIGSTKIDPSNPMTLFRYIQGNYFLRISECTKYPSKCRVVSCSQLLVLRPQVAKNTEVCTQSPSNVSAVKIRDTTKVLDFHTCSVEVNAVVPLCTARQDYSKARVFTVEVGLDGDCSLADFYQGGGQKNLDNDTIPVLPCDVTGGPSDRHCNASSLFLEGHVGILQHRLYDLSRNSSYCLFYQVQNPHCSSGSGGGDLPCFFYTHKITCQLLYLSPFSLLTEPMFIGVVSLTLFLSLTLLMWTMIQCSKKRPETPVQQPIKKPPRSLTEDDLEHISRLPSQEIVLVYFPDSKRFKELNRKFRSWLITLDVNDVKDIYDEKTSEDVLKDPEAWVRKTLGGPEKRIILVCSRLAYECLVTVKKGISSPKFVETDPHFGLLTRSIHYLDKEMKGNYRNLICVRYEDLKICDRQFSSEAFNIVPGTEYVLPQHLEDVYRWIHPRDPKPECWSEHRQEVRELMEAMKTYRTHDENMFTVQFTTTSSAGHLTPGSSTPCD